MRLAVRSDNVASAMVEKEAGIRQAAGENFLVVLGRFLKITPPAAVKFHQWFRRQQPAHERCQRLVVRLRPLLGHIIWLGGHPLPGPQALLERGAPKSAAAVRIRAQTGHAGQAEPAAHHRFLLLGRRGPESRLLVRPRDAGRLRPASQKENEAHAANKKGEAVRLARSYARPA